ncbi:MAG: hypothetical protein E7680_06445 [Ruminococcaceae bacterium]|nr:hypothetical protein [Oscillospiraceae bacterium]
MKDLSEYKSEIRRQMNEKKEKKAAFYKRLAVSLSLCASIAVCCCIALIVVNSPIGKSVGKASNEAIADQKTENSNSDFDEKSAGMTDQDLQERATANAPSEYGRSPIGSETVNYGTFSGCRVWMIQGQCCVNSIQEVAGYKFIHSGSFAINVEKNGTVYQLQEAYQYGYLSDEDIAELYRLHKEYEFEYHNGEFLYQEYE